MTSHQFHGMANPDFDHPAMKRALAALRAADYPAHSSRSRVAAGP